MNHTPQILVNYKKIDHGFLGQCIDNPQFLVQTKSKNKIKVEIKEMIEDYVKVFPKEKNIILPNGNKFIIILKER